MNVCCCKGSSDLVVGASSVHQVDAWCIMVYDVGVVGNEKQDLFIPHHGYAFISDRKAPAFPIRRGFLLSDLELLFTLL